MELTVSPQLNYVATLPCKVQFYENSRCSICSLIKKIIVIFYQFRLILTAAYSIFTR